MRKEVIFVFGFLMALLFVGGVSAVQYADCNAVPPAVLGGRTCQPVLGCGSLSGSNIYYLLTSNLTSGGTCIHMLAQHNVLDLNEYYINFAQSGSGNGTEVMRSQNSYLGAEIKNGKIRSGYHFSAGIDFCGAVSGVAIHDISLYAAGIGSYGIRIENEGSNFPTNISIYGNTITMNTSKAGCNMVTRECSPCDHYGDLPTGIFMTHVNGPITVDRNNITGYGVSGIIHSDCGALSAQNPFVITNNYISMWSVVADGYAIGMAALSNGCSGGTLIMNNTIDQLNGRGIGISGWNTETDYGPGDMEIAYNNITVKNGGDCETDGQAYGIRLRFGVHDMYVHNNHIKTIAGVGVVDGYKTNDSLGEALSIGSTSPYGLNNRFYNNVIEAYSNSPNIDDDYHAYTRNGATGIYVQDAGGGPPAHPERAEWDYYFNNTIFTNNIGVRNYGYNAAGYKNVFNGTKIIYVPGVAPYRPILIGGYYGGAQETLFLDTQVTGDNVHNFFFRGALTQQVYTQLNLSWTTDVKVVDNLGNPLDANVEIRDKSGNLVSQGSTVQGKYSKVLTEVQWTGTTLLPVTVPGNITYSPYTITATFGGDSQTEVVYVNKTLTGADEIVFSFGSNNCSEGVIISACECEGKIYQTGYCCDMTNTPGGIFFDPGYSGCPTGNWYYVSQLDGNCLDSPTAGTSSQPWCSLKYATDRVGAGSTVIVKAGSYIDTTSTQTSAFNPVSSGTLSNPIIFKSYPRYSAIVQRNSYVTPAFRVGGVENIVIDGFTAYGTLGARSSEYITFKNNNISVGSQEGVENPSIKYGIVLEATNYSKAINNFVSNIFSNSADDNYNTGGISVFGLPEWSGGFIVGYTPGIGNLIEHNEVIAGSTIYAAFGQKGGPQWDNIWRYNIARDARIAYYGRGDTSNTMMSSNNSYYQNLAINSVNAFYFAQINSAFNISNNVAYNVDRFTTSTQIPSQYNHSFWNNLVVANDYCYTRGYSDSFSVMINYSNYNNFQCPTMGFMGEQVGPLVFYNTLSNWQGQGFDSFSTQINADSEFVDYANEDFHLNPGSSFRTLGIDRQDYDHDGDVAERIPAGMYITGDEIIGLIDYTTTSGSSGSSSGGGGGSPDVNSDGSINIIDLALATYWQGKNVNTEPRYSHLDVNKDGVLDWGDVVEIIRNMI